MLTRCCLEASVSLMLTGYASVDWALPLRYEPAAKPIVGAAVARRARVGAAAGGGGSDATAAATRSAERVDTERVNTERVDDAISLDVLADDDPRRRLPHSSHMSHTPLYPHLSI